MDLPLQEKLIDTKLSVLDQAVLNLRLLILASEHYRQVIAESMGLGTTESQALSYLAVHGSVGQSELARDLGLTSSALTALVDRLERDGVAERVSHASDRRRSIVQLTERGDSLLSGSHGWLAATLERIDPAALEVLSASLKVVAGDLSTRTSNDGSDAWSGTEDEPPA